MCGTVGRSGLGHQQRWLEAHHSSAAVAHHPLERAQLRGVCDR